MTDKKMPAAGEFCWNELMTSDVQKAKKFYSALMGWDCAEHDMGDMTYTMFKQGNNDVGGMMQIPHGHEKEMPPHWMSYICVKNLKDVVAKAKTLGAKVVRDVTHVADFGQFAVVQDPTGAHIAFWESMKNC